MVSNFKQCIIKRNFISFLKLQKKFLKQPFHCARSLTDKAWHDPLRMKAQLITNLFFVVAGFFRALHRWLSPFSFDRISPHPNFGYEIGTRYSPWKCNSRIKGNYSPYWIIMIENYLFVFLEIFVTSLSFYKKNHFLWIF